MTCWLAQFSSKPCDGRMDPAHLLSKQLLRRKGIEWAWDVRFWVPACRYHHGQFDNYRLTVPRESIPASLESLCEELGLVHALDRRYGPLEAVESATSPE
jgi:hypothetical protein